MYYSFYCSAVCDICSALSEYCIIFSTYIFEMKFYYRVNTGHIFLYYMYISPFLLSHLSSGMRVRVCVCVISNSARAIIDHAAQTKNHSTFWLSDRHDVDMHLLAIFFLIFFCCLICQRVKCLQMHLICGFQIKLFTWLYCIVCEMWCVWCASMWLDDWRHFSAHMGVLPLNR